MDDEKKAMLKMFIWIAVGTVVGALFLILVIWPFVTDVIFKVTERSASQANTTPFSITVRILGKNTKFTVTEGTSIRRLKKLINEATKIPIQSMRLKIRGVGDEGDDMKDNMTLGQYRFKADASPQPIIDLSIKGGLINYTLEHPEYIALDDHDKMNYAQFMLNYDVEKNKEFVEGAKSAMCEKAQGATGIEGHIQRFFACNASWEMIKRPQRLVNFLTFISFFLIVFMFCMWIAFLLIGAIGNAFGKIWIAPVKAPTLFIMIVTVCGVMALMHIFQHFYDRAVDRVEIVGLNIK